MSKAPERIYILDRSVPEPNSGCWLWERSTFANGYGQAHINSRKWYAHRLSFEVYKRPIKTGEVIRHTCDTPSCVNPDHLIGGSQKENLVDAKRRKRLREGEDNPACKYSDELISYIRESSKSNVSLSNELNIDYRYIWQIRQNQRRKTLSR